MKQYCAGSGSIPVEVRPYLDSMHEMLGRCGTCDRILKVPNWGRLRKHSVRGRNTRSHDNTMESLWAQNEGEGMTAVKPEKAPAKKAAKKAPARKATAKKATTRGPKKNRSATVRGGVTVKKATRKPAVKQAQPKPQPIDNHHFAAENAHFAIGLPVCVRDNAQPVGWEKSGDPFSDYWDKDDYGRSFPIKDVADDGSIEVMGWYWSPTDVYISYR